MTGIGKESNLYLRFSSEGFLEEATSAPGPERSIGVRSGVCTCICVCVSTCVCLCTCLLCMHLYLCMNAPVCGYMHMHVCLYLFICACTCTCVLHICMHLCVFISVRGCVHMFTLLWVCVHVYVCACVWHSGDRIRRVARSESRKPVGTRHWKVLQPS